MSIFSSISTMFSSATAGLDTGSGDASYNNSPLLGVYKPLSYKECANIYKYWPLGKRVATALPNFASTSPSELGVKGTPEEVKQRLEKVFKDLKLEEAVTKLTVYTRIFGSSSIYLASKTLKPDEALTYEKAQKADFRLNVLDPLALGNGVLIDNDPLSMNFGLPTTKSIRGAKVHESRLFLLQQEYPLYYEWNQSNWSFGGPSIYTNMSQLIRTWNICFIAIQRLATKSSAMYANLKETPNTTSINITSSRRNLELIRELENDGIVGLRNGESINFFPTSSVGSFINEIISVTNTALMMALSDTPSGILLDKNLSTGLADGSEDMKAILMSVDRFRNNLMRPVTDFLSKLLCYKAFSPKFLQEIKSKFPDLYRTKSVENMLDEFVANFEWKFGELYPQTISQLVEEQKNKLEILRSIKEFGGNIDSIEEAINSLNCFEGVDFTLDEPTDSSEHEGDENE